MAGGIIWVEMVCPFDAKPTLRRKWAPGGRWVKRLCHDCRRDLRAKGVRV